MTRSPSSSPTRPIPKLSGRPPFRFCRNSPQIRARRRSRPMWPDSRTTTRWCAPRRLARCRPSGLNRGCRRLVPGLQISVRAVRIEAARMLAGVPLELMSPEQRAAFEKASVELIDAQMASAERPEAHLTLGAFYAEQRRAVEAEAAYRTALRLDPEFVPAMVNLADLYRALQRDADGEPLLRQALGIEPDNADAHHALGLLLVRRDRLADAIQSFALAAELAPDNGRYAYVYGIALNSTGKSSEALDVLRRARERRPADADILSALASISRDTGDKAAAIAYAEELVRLLPNDAQARALLESLTRQ